MRRSGLGREAPVIHYSSPKNSDKWGGQRAAAWKERTNEKIKRWRDSECPCELDHYRGDKGWMSSETKVLNGKKRE